MLWMLTAPLPHKLTPLKKNNSNQYSAHLRPLLSSFITHQHIPMTWLDTNKREWCYMCTVMLTNLVNQNHESEGVVIIIICQDQKTPPNNLNIQ